jgi:hypothetical protein
MFIRLLTMALFLSFASTALAKTYYSEVECTKTISIAGPTIADTLHRLVKENGTRITDVSWAKNWFRLKDLELAREMGNEGFQLGTDNGSYRIPPKVKASDITALARLLAEDVNARVITYQPIRRGPTFESIFLKDLVCGITENTIGYEGESKCNLTVEVNCDQKTYTELNK